MMTGRGDAAMPALPDFVTPLGHGIYAVDTDFHRPRFDAAFLLVDEGRAAFIDTGTGLAVPRLLAALDALGLAREAVDWIIPTHVHLDHAGGVGVLLPCLPNAQVLVHPRGARHLIDPRMLYQGALAVYGQAEMDRSYGVLQPVAAARVSTSEDDQVIQVGTRRLRLIDAPGHARHHHAVWDDVSRGWFTGDTFGLSYRELDVDGQAWILPTTTPVQFEPDALRHTIHRMLAAQPERMYLTHYSVVEGAEALGRQLLSSLDEVVALRLGLREAPDRHSALKDALRQLYLRQLRSFGSRLSDEEIEACLAMDIELNAQGMACWLDRPGA